MIRRGIAFLTALLLGVYPCFPPAADAYVLNRTVGNSGGCPKPNRQLVGTNSIERRWAVGFPNSKYQTSIGFIAGSGTLSQRQEIEDAIAVSFHVWASGGTTLAPSSLQAIQRINNPTNNECSFSDGRNTICFNEADTFATGVIAQTTVVSALFAGQSLGSKTAGSVGEILDADILFNPGDASIILATRTGMSTNTLDFESVLIHEIGHSLGFSHSGILRAIMYPFAPPPGTFLGGQTLQDRCPSPIVTGQPCDRPLADDDRAGLRVLYPNPADTLNVGTISGRVVPANPISLASAQQPGLGAILSGMFGTHVVAVDADSGAVVAGVLGGWSCDPQNPPAKFDGSFLIEGLKVPGNYKLLVEPLDSPVTVTNIDLAVRALCDPSSPTPCRVPCNPAGERCDFDNSGNPRGTPVLNLNFTTKVKE